MAAMRGWVVVVRGVCERGEVEQGFGGEGSSLSVSLLPPVAEACCEGLMPGSN